VVRRDRILHTSPAPASYPRPKTAQGQETGQCELLSRG
jgi:hypothetical protein